MNAFASLTREVAYDTLIFDRQECRKQLCEMTHQGVHGRLPLPMGLGPPSYEQIMIADCLQPVFPKSNGEITGALTEPMFPSVPLLLAFPLMMKVTVVVDRDALTCRQREGDIELALPTLERVARQRVCGSSEQPCEFTCHDLLYEGRLRDLAQVTARSMLDTAVHTLLIVVRRIVGVRDTAPPDLSWLGV